MLFDPGLQPERTALAWRRTGAGFLVNAGLVARFAHSTRLERVTYALAAVIAVLGLGTLAYARALYARRVTDRPVAEPAALRLLWVATTATTLASAALIALT